MLIKTNINPLWMVLIFAGLFCPFAQSQTDPRVSSRLLDLEQCLKKGGSRSEIERRRYAVSKLRKGFEGGWKTALRRPDQESSVTPDEYLQSLDRDAVACSTAQKIKDKKERSRVLDSITDDLRLKADDCQIFGMGRNVPVSVVTVIGTKHDNGWEVFYKWVCSSGFPVDEVRAPQLTSPATLSLPPGQYLFRAQKRGSDGQLKKSDQVKIIVALQSDIECQLPVQ
jgi:hypothetical protein